MTACGAQRSGLRWPAGCAALLVATCCMLLAAVVCMLLLQPFVSSFDLHSCVALQHLAMPALLRKEVTQLLASSASGQELLGRCKHVQEAINKFKQTQQYRKADASRRSELLRELEDRRTALHHEAVACSVEMRGTSMGSLARSLQEAAAAIGTAQVAFDTLEVADSMVAAGAAADREPEEEQAAAGNESPPASSEGDDSSSSSTTESVLPLRKDASEHSQQPAPAETTWGHCWAIGGKRGGKGIRGRRKKRNRRGFRTRQARDRQEKLRAPHVEAFIDYLGLRRPAQHLPGGDSSLAEVQDLVRELTRKRDREIECHVRRLLRVQAREAASGSSSSTDRTTA